ncbi:MAG TPA: lipoprotein [Burkholderiaceae bacterium]|nr:lipoprotein [Burkholderiaceae bacterium]
MRANRHWMPLIVALALLTACGQKGPLFLPGHSKDTPWPVRTNPPAPGAAPGPGAAAPGSAGSGASALTPAPEVQADQAGANAKDSASTSGAASGDKPENPGNAAQAPQ